MTLINRLYKQHFLSDGFNALTILIYALIVAVLPQIPTFQDDTNCWGRWSEYIFQHGLSQIYSSDTNYLPLYHYVLWLYGKVMGSVAAINHNLHYLRSVTLLFDIWSMWVVWQWIGKRINYNVIIVMYFLNLAYSYDTVIWGQVDDIEAALVFAAFYAAWRRRIILSAMLLVLAINMKLQAVIFFPLWLLLILPTFMAKGRLKNAIKTTIVIIGTQCFILWPFAYGDGGWTAIWRVIHDSVDQVPKISVNAYNWWYWITNDYPGSVSDKILIFGRSYKFWGLLSFAVGLILCLLPIVYITYKHIKLKTCNYSINETNCILLSATLTGLLFFFCNTQIHERYAVPAFIFLAAYTFRQKRYLLYSILSASLFLNMEGSLRWLGLYNYDTLIFNGKFVAVIYSIGIIIAFVELYRISRMSYIVKSIFNNKRINLF